jgi:positive regulator of sigma E activity
MMGLSETALIGSWFVTYVVIWALVSGILVGVTSDNMFKHTSTNIIFAFFFLYGIVWVMIP